MENESQAVAIPAKPEAGLVEWAQTVQVTCKPEADAVMLRVKEVKTQRKRWWDYWTPLCQEADKHHDNLVAKRKEGTDIADNIIKPVESKVLAWQRAEDDKAAAEQRRLQAIADEQARKDSDRLKREAEKLKTPELKAARLEEAAAVFAPTVTITAEKSVAGTKKTWKARLVDKDALLSAAGPGSIASTFFVFDQAAANKFAASNRGQTQIPGIKWYEEMGFTGKIK